MAQFEWVHAAWLALAIVLEIVANVFLKFSDGFRRKIFGLLSLAAVLAAFSALSQAVKGIDLSVAYALWGGFGIAATLAAGWILGLGSQTSWFCVLIIILIGLFHLGPPDPVRLYGIDARPPDPVRPHDGRSARVLLRR